MFLTTHLDGFHDEKDSIWHALFSLNCFNLNIYVVIERKGLTEGFVSEYCLMVDRNVTSFIHVQCYRECYITVITMQTIQINQQTLQVFREFYKTVAWQPVHSQLESFRLNHSQLLPLSAASDKFFTVRRNSWPLNPTSLRNRVVECATNPRQPTYTG